MTGVEETKANDLHTVDSIAATVGLEGLCKLFGWQGGTIHQTKAEIRRHLARDGIFPRKTDGVLCGLVIDTPKQNEKENPV